MKTKLNILLLAAAMSFVSWNVSAQESNEYSDKKKKQNEEAINTNKETPVKIIQYIVGKWEIDRIYKGTKDITNADTVGSNRTIEFDREGKYMMSSGNESENGSYRLNENHSILYLESEKSQQPSEWKVSFSNNGAMTLQPAGTYAHAESFKYVYVRTSAAASRQSDQQN